jgi:hypothetical protein
LIPASTSTARWNWSARYPNGRLEVSPRVNNARKQDADLTEPLTA